MADNRTTAISNIQALNVPTVTNDILNTILAELWGNTQFLADVAVPQVTATTNTVLNFANKDRIDLDMTGISGDGVNLTFNGVSDGQTVYALITKTNTKTITIVGAVDITPNPEYVTIATNVLYRVTRKGTLYVAEALVKTVNPASTSVAGIVEIATLAEHNALTVTDKVCVPGNLPKTSETQTGIAQYSTDTQVDNSTDSEGGEPLVPKPSQLRDRTYQRRITRWQNDTQTVYKVDDPNGNVTDFTFTFTDTFNPSFVPMFTIVNSASDCRITAWVKSESNVGDNTVVVISARNGSTINNETVTIYCGIQIMAGDPTDI